jgi:hypothetical protein
LNQLVEIVQRTGQDGLRQYVESSQLYQRDCDLHP